jgi:hypothetical protein
MLHFSLFTFDFLNFMFKLVFSLFLFLLLLLLLLLFSLFFRIRIRLFLGKNFDDNSHVTSIFMKYYYILTLIK